MGANESRGPVDPVLANLETTVQDNNCQWRRLMLGIWLQDVALAEAGARPAEEVAAMRASALERAALLGSISFGCGVTLEERDGGLRIGACIKPDCPQQQLI